MVQNGRVYPDHACVHEFLNFCNPYGVICTFYKVPHGTACRDPNGRGSAGGDAVIALGGPKNTSEHSRMVQNGRVYPDHACVHEFLDFCNPYGVICMFYRAQHGTEHRDLIEWRTPIFGNKRELGGPKNT